jgi:hypothetical protein
MTQRENIESFLNTVNTSINTPENITASGELKEGIILDLSKQLQEKFESILNLEIDLNRENRILKKKFLRLYGLVSTIDKMTNESIEVPHELQTLINCLSDFICEAVEEYFFPQSFGGCLDH